MDFSQLTNLCQCVKAQTCPFCEVLVIVGVVVLGIVLGYLIGKRKVKT